MQVSELALPLSGTAHLFSDHFPLAKWEERGRAGKRSRPNGIQLKEKCGFDSIIWNLLISFWNRIKYSLCVNTIRILIFCVLCTDMRNYGYGESILQSKSSMERCGGTSDLVSIIWAVIDSFTAYFPCSVCKLSPISFHWFHPKCTITTHSRLV